MLVYRSVVFLIWHVIFSILALLTAIQKKTKTLYTSNISKSSKILRCLQNHCAYPKMIYEFAYPEFEGVMTTASTTCSYSPWTPWHRVILKRCQLAMFPSSELQTWKSTNQKNFTNSEQHHFQYMYMYIYVQLFPHTSGFYEVVFFERVQYVYKLNKKSGQPVWWRKKNKKWPSNVRIAAGQPRSGCVAFCNTQSVAIATFVAWWLQGAVFHSTETIRKPTSSKSAAVGEQKLK